MARQSALLLLLAAVAPARAETMLWAGGVTSTSANLRVEALRDTRLIISTTKDLKAPVRGEDGLPVKRGVTSITNFNGLAPDTQYYYGLAYNT